VSSTYPGGIEDCDRFRELVELFNDEEQRNYYYHDALETVEEELERPDWYQSDDLVFGGLMLLMYTWNFAARETKAMDGEEVKRILDRHHDAIENVQDRTLEDADLSETGETRQVIQQVWGDLKGHFGQTGASKVLSLLNPDLFVMWDTDIRGVGKQGADVKGVKYYMREQGFYDGNLSDFDGDKENYLEYLRYCQQILEDTQDCQFIQDKYSPPAKLLDEAFYAYYKIENED
jgi:hypothetical protein